jgi:hypothetical protein
MITNVIRIVQLGFPIINEWVKEIYEFKSSYTSLRLCFIVCSLLNGGNFFIGSAGVPEIVIINEND